MSRPRLWQHQDGFDCGVQALAHCITDDMAHIVDRHFDLYTSFDMKIGVDNVKLIEFNSSLQKLNELDPRGGFFSQPMMEAALQVHIDASADMKAALGGGPVGLPHSGVNCGSLPGQRRPRWATGRHQVRNRS